MLKLLGLPADSEMLLVANPLLAALRAASGAVARGSWRCGVRGACGASRGDPASSAAFVGICFGLMGRSAVTQAPVGYGLRR